MSKSAFFEKLARKRIKMKGVVKNEVVDVEKWESPNEEYFLALFFIRT